ncbi:MAG TPA: NAD-dependent epimerase/dehydratase family protein [Streptosporangiaceae bacterium]|nr:NAD-dependent epimerase/dehydratase family protein [Streptosporangiaceae bacterium]
MTPADDRAVLITGGAGFIGINLCRALLQRGRRIIAADNMSSAQLPIPADLLDHERFSLIELDVTEPFEVPEPVGEIIHLAGPFSPAQPFESLRTASLGAFNTLEVARTHGARVVVASSGDVYGDATEHPQREDYWGNVDPTGPRSSFEEARRFLEATATAYRRELGVRTGIIRPFNIYGPDLVTGRRVVPAFIAKALAGEDLVLRGGEQTRTLCFIDDFVAGVIAMLQSDEPGPINMGSEEEITIRELATLIVEICSSSSSVTVVPTGPIDSKGRCPDISKARTVLGWQPTTPLRTGLATTIQSMRKAQVTAL